MRAAFLVGIMAMALAACSPLDSGSRAVADVVAASAQASQEKGSVAFELTAEGSLGGEGFEFEMTMEGVVDFDARRTKTVMDLGFWETESIYADGVTYTRGFGGDTSDQWVRVDLDLEDSFSGMAGSPEGLDQLTEWFALLRAEALEIEQLETDVIRGVEAIRYRLRFDAVAADRGGLEGVEVLDVWIDDDDLVRRMSAEVVIDGVFGEDPTTTSMVIEYFDYGTAPDIELPPEDDVIDFEEWLESDPVGSFDDWATDPFEDADCYGEALAACLEPNAELADLYADPATCQSGEPRVCLVPVGNVRRDVVEAIIDFHRETREIEIVVLPAVRPAEDHIDFDLSQGLGEPIFDDVLDRYGVDDSTRSTYIAVTPFDLRPADDGLGWYFGFRNGGDYTGHLHGIFSYFRMANVEPYDLQPLDDELLFERATKYFARYVASLHLGYPLEDDFGYLNYEIVWGFSDLDSMGAEWPVGDPPCVTDAEVVCLVPDGDHDFSRTQLEDVASRLEEHFGMPVQVRHLDTGYASPTRDPWSEEFRDDLGVIAWRILERPNVTVIGVTDDLFTTNGPGRGPHVSVAWPDQRVAVASTAGAGEPGTEAFAERMFRVLVRAIETGHLGLPETDDPESVRFSGHATPHDLDGLALVPVE